MANLNRARLRPPPDAILDHPNIRALTPVERRGDFWIKRDDLFAVAGVRGGKVRSCLRLALAARHAGAHGLVTASSRHSPQLAIVALVARHIGLHARCHVPAGPATAEMRIAQDAGAALVEHRPGYNTVVISRARQDAAATGWAEIPFGMKCQQAVLETARQVANLPQPEDIKRIVVPVGSAVSLSGILTGIDMLRQDLVEVPIIGVRMGAAPEPALDALACFGWRSRVQLLPALQRYEELAKDSEFEGIKLDNHYEGKAVPFLEPGDLFWIVGIRPSQDLGDRR